MLSRPVLFNFFTPCSHGPIPWPRSFRLSERVGAYLRRMGPCVLDRISQRERLTLAFHHTFAALPLHTKVYSSGPYRCHTYVQSLMCMVDPRIGCAQQLLTEPDVSSSWPSRPRGRRIWQPAAEVCYLGQNISFWALQMRLEKPRTFSALPTSLRKSVAIP